MVRLTKNQLSLLNHLVLADGWIASGYVSASRLHALERRGLAEKRLKWAKNDREYYYFRITPAGRAALLESQGVAP